MIERMKDMSTKGPAETVWRDLIGMCVQHGIQVAPRATATNMGDQTTFELINSTCMVDMEFPVITNLMRKLSYKFMFAEAYWILSGSDKLAEIAPFNERMRRFSDDGETLAGAYGPRIKSQMQYVVNKLIEDKQSRQAVMSIWKDNPPESLDIPCTLNIQFLIRDNYLHTLVNMRSSDIYLGWPYDIFVFTMVSTYLILTLRTQYPDLKLGMLCHRAGSLHLYSRDQNRAQECLIRPTVTGLNALNPAEFSGAGDLVEWLKLMRDGKADRTKKTFLKELVK